MYFLKFSLRWFPSSRVTVHYQMGQEPKTQFHIIIPGNTALLDMFSMEFSAFNRLKFFYHYFINCFCTQYKPHNINYKYFIFLGHVSPSATGFILSWPNFVHKSPLTRSIFYHFLQQVAILCQPPDPPRWPIY